MKPIALIAVLIVAATPALAMPPAKPPDAKFLAAVDKAIADAQTKAVPTPKLLKLAKRLIARGRLIRANEVAELIARKKTDTDLAVARKINAAVAECRNIVGTWTIGNNSATHRHCMPDGKVLGHSGKQSGSWKVLGRGKYEVRTPGHRLIMEPLGLAGTAVRVQGGDPAKLNEKLPCKRVK